MTPLPYRHRLEKVLLSRQLKSDTAIADNAADSDADIEVAVESLDDAQPVAVSPTEKPLTESSARVLVEAAIQEVQNDAAQSSADNDQNTDAITLTDEQINSLVSGLLDGSIAPRVWMNSYTTSLSQSMTNCEHCFFS